MSLESRQDAPLILALECSGNAASAAVLKAGKIAGFAEHPARHGHAQTLIDLCDRAIKMAKCVAEDITHIAAGCGPGSFTGLRVCLSAAKGYQMALGAQALGVSGLSALAFHGMATSNFSSKSYYLSLADSRRGTFFAQLFDAHAQPASPIYDLNAQELTVFCRDKILEDEIENLVCCGQTETELLKMDELEELIQRPDIQNSDHHLDARDIANYGLAALMKGPFYLVGAFQPLYIATPKLGSKTIAPSRTPNR